ncbi:hypothetical protein HDA32_000003 [Spinactinospora alkalitolerans]|uniref:Uncharacterized protein n=1 Tax=Spinactinospora alkalitolerans TaxID=687207 RepID=A0A852TQD8_9ACTN|nr:hypothetical protein [Spinactinospora alkalitolerans]
MIVWYGEHSGRWYATDGDGLHERDSIDALTLLLG